MAKGEKNPPPKTTHDDVEYEFVGIRRNGNTATLTVAATNKRGTKDLIRTLRVKLIASDGSVYQSPVGSSGGKTPAMGRLREGTRQLVEFDLGELPTDLSEFSSIMIPGKDGAGMAKALRNPVLLRGTFKVEK